MEINKRIQSKRRALGLTQAELAGELDVSPQFVSALETGASAPSLHVLVRLATTLGTTTDYLLTGREHAPLQIAGAIRADKTLTPASKRALIALIAELHGH